MPDPLKVFLSPGHSPQWTCDCSHVDPERIAASQDQPHKEDPSNVADMPLSLQPEPE